MPTRLSLERVLTISLGGLWLIDGILQLQPAMFTNAFVDSVLTPNLQNQPAIIAAIVAFGIRIFGANVFWANLASALIQLLIGGLLIFPFKKTTQRFGLWLSVAWALIVWIFGEGFGNLFTGTATFFSGAPGSALLYLILALFLLYRFSYSDKRLPTIAGVIFIFGAFLDFATISWEASILACLGLLLIFFPKRWVAWISVAFLIIVWWIGQNFGGLQTFPLGTATDPNSAPLLILFLLPIAWDIPHSK